MADIVEVYVPGDRPFIVACPQCGKNTECAARPATPAVEAPFPFTCSCGRQLQIRVNVRTSFRKRVNLTATVAIGSLGRPEVCTIEDLSLKGLQLSVYSTSSVTAGQRATVKVVLDDRARNKVTLTGVVSRAAKSATRLVLGIEFDPLPPSEAQTLAFYFM
jgi:hypothetical protein